ncbi:BEL1-like homeodomain protein 1 [Silene latifolia]|uniref:BEL1-like homeodomain protein 1 n=1 Tax=Silene latifolia TaxID=37657 RepID=UPI003D772BD4
MASYYVPHDNSTSTSTTTTPQQIPENANLHTLILMQQHHQQQQQQSNNILLLNSAAAAAAFSHPPPQQFHHQFGRPDHQNITLYGYPQEETREITRASQGLSLSLNSQNPGGVGHVAGTGGGQVSVLGSKYLRAAQELLEQVVNVGDTLTTNPNTNNTSSVDGHSHSPGKGKGVDDTQSDENEKHSGATQLSTSERQEIQMKKAKLVSMLDEAEQRYRHYNNQMQMVIESFERVAGMGSAKTYTALALKTISKQFRCLKDAIQDQIRVANKSLGEDDGGVGSSGGKIQGSRLKFIDHQIRQQRALQQLGMIQNHNAWRPQRGLPERSVSVLRAWLFEHFLHPYPKDSDKILLAKQTGLTRSQVSNWFINARVRLWKPMIEEMYNEELKDREQNNSEDKENSNNEDIEGASNSIIEQEKFNNGDQTQLNNSAYQHGFTLTGSLEMEGIAQASPKRQRSNNQVVNNNGEILIKFGNDDKEEGNNVYPMISGGMNFMGGGELGIGSYPMNELGRFETEDFPAPSFVQGNNGGISLSLGVGLPPCDNNNHHQQQHFNSHSFMSSNQNISFPRGNDFGSIDIQSRKGFVAQLLPDFVA